MYGSPLVVKGDGLSDLGAFNLERLQVEAGRKGQGGSFRRCGGVHVSGSGACLDGGVKLMIVTFDNHQQAPRKGLSLLAEKGPGILFWVLLWGNTLLTTYNSHL